MAKATAKKPARNIVATAAKMAAGALTGAAFGTIMVREIEEKAKQEVKAQISLKDRLRTLCSLDPKGHAEFRATLEKRVEQMNDAAKGLNQSLAQYREGNAEAASIYVMLSMWKSLSLATAAGYQPNFDQPWSTITQMATAYKNSTGKAVEQVNKLSEERSKLVADTAMDAQKKAQKLVELDKKLDTARHDAAKKPDYTTRVGGEGRPAMSLIDKVFKVIDGQPLQELEKLAAWMTEYVAKQQAAAKASTSGRVKTANQQAAADPAFKAPAKTEERATANSGKASKRKARA